VVVHAERGRAGRDDGVRPGVHSMNQSQPQFTDNLD
jgi:hypothetical protein